MLHCFIMFIFFSPIQFNVKIIIMWIELLLNICGVNSLSFLCQNHKRYLWEKKIKRKQLNLLQNKLCEIHWNSRLKETIEKFYFLIKNCFNCQNDRGYANSKGKHQPAGSSKNRERASSGEFHGLVGNILRGSGKISFLWILCKKK